MEKENYPTLKNTFLQSFSTLSEEEEYKEFLFCLLTPQSNAQKCWTAVEQLFILKPKNEEETAKILNGKARFHNNKAKYVQNAKETWSKIKNSLNNTDIRELRNSLAKNVKGYGLKEASHFLRNIGKSNNNVAILDRHILKNLKELGIIETNKIKSKNHYLELENKFIQFSKSLEIPMDELDLLFWSKENGQIFK
jgi:N-glycosylase/DNA lyase